MTPPHTSPPQLPRERLLHLSANAKARLPRPITTFPWSYLLLAGICLIALLALALNNNSTTEAQQRPTASKLKQANIPFNGDQAYHYLKEICAIGPRVSGTEGMARQQAYLKSHFE